MGEIQSRPLYLSVKAPIEVEFQNSRVRSNEDSIRIHRFHKWLGVLKRLFVLVRQKNSWSPLVLAGELWRYLINLGMRREVLRLLKLRPFAEITQNSPAFAFKYLAPDYLAKGFKGNEGSSCFLHHYRRIHSALPEGVLRQILQGSITLHEIAEGGNRFVLALGLSEPIGDKEGELSLELQVDGRKVFNLSFTVVPGWAVKSPAAEILLITRIQGAKGSLSQLRLARKAFHEFIPSKVLFAALTGIADALGICELRAICATRQRAYSKKDAATLKRNYDDFFVHLGMTVTTDGFYSISVPIEDRPLASIKGRNRSRARKRRAIRRQIRLACAAFFLGAADRTAESSSNTVNSTPFPGTVESRLSPIFSQTAD